MEEKISSIKLNESHLVDKQLISYQQDEDMIPNFKANDSRTNSIISSQYHTSKFQQQDFQQEAGEY